MTLARQSRTKSLGFKSIRSLGRAIGVSTERLQELAQGCKDGYPYTSWKEPKKSGIGYRRIETPDTGLKRTQERINRLLQRVAMPGIFHGCYANTHIKSNAIPHLRGRQFEQFDLADYYFRIHHSQVYNGFIRLGCSPNVARILTQLTTIHGHVPQGAPTSPIVAVIAMLKMAKRLQELCYRINARITIYGDNICISGPPHIRNYGSTVRRIIRQSGFSERPAKHVSLDRSEPWILPGLEIARGTIDVALPDYAALLQTLLICQSIGSDGLRLVVCPRFRSKLEGQLFHYQWVGTLGEKQMTARAREISDAFARIKWPDGFDRSACRSKKCECGVT